MARRPIMLMRKKNLLGTIMGKYANLQNTVAKGVGHYYDVSGGGYRLKMNSGFVSEDGLTVTVIFSQNVFFTELTIPNGMVFTNTTTADTATITVTNGSGTGQAEYTVTWGVAIPVYGDVLQVEYDGLGDYQDADNVPMEAQTLSIANQAVPIGVPLAITTQPVNVTVTEPSPATFTCIAEGTLTVTYQWYLGGSLQSGETSTTYTIDPTSEQTSDVYCQVNDFFGVPLDSNTVTLTVEAVAPTLAITVQPTNQTVNEPNAATFSITATGVGTITYQWKLNGGNIGSANSSSYNTGSTTEGQTGSYTCEVNDDTGAPLLSDAASLTVNQASSTVAPLVDRLDYRGSNAIEVSSITPVIELRKTTDNSPCLIDCTVLGSTATGTAFGGQDVDPIVDIEWSWLCTYADGTPITDKTPILNPTTGRNISLYHDQVKPKASFLIEDLDPNDYLITLTGRAPDGAGGYTVSTASASFSTVTPTIRLDHQFVDGLNGSDTNTGLDPKGIAYSDGTYDNVTGILTSLSSPFTPYIADTEPSWNRDNYHYIEGVTRRVEYISPTQLQVAEEDRAGISATVPTSLVTDGPIQTIYKDADPQSMTFHINGNAGATTYTLNSSRQRIGIDSKTNRVNHFFYNGDPANDGKVLLTIDATYNPAYAVYQDSSQSETYMMNVDIDANFLCNIAIKELDSSSGYALAYTKVRYNLTFRNGLANNTVYIQDDAGDTRPTSAFALIKCDLIHPLGGGLTSTGNTGMIATGAKETWVTIMGGRVQAYGEGIDNIHVHFFYYALKNDRSDMAYVYGDTTSNETRFNYFINVNPKGGTGTGDQVTLALLAVTDCYGKDNARFIDISGTNNDNTDSWMDKAYVARNSMEVRGAASNGFFEGFNIVSINLVENTFNAVLHNNVSKGFNVAARDVSNVRVTNNLLYNTGIFEAGVNTGSAGSWCFAFNEQYDPTSTVEVAKYRSDNISAHDYYDNTYSTPSVSEYIKDGVDGLPDALAVFNSNVDAVAGAGSATESVATPDWQDVSANNFLPAGYATLPPAITTQPASTSEAVDSNATFFIDTTQADTYQWQVNDGGGYVDVAGARASIITVPKVQEANDGDLYQCLITNDAGTTSSSPAALTVAGAAPLIITTQPISVTVTEPSPATFTCVATGQGTVTYQWYLASVLQGGETASAYTIDPTTEQVSDVYCQVNDDTGTPLNSNAVTLTVNAVVAPQELTLNGASYLGIPLTTLAIGDKVSIALKFVNGDLIQQILNDGGGLRLSSASKILFDPDLTATIDTVSVLYNENVSVYLDGTSFYTWEVTYIETTDLAWFGADVNYDPDRNFLFGSLKNITIDKTANGGGVTTWAINSGSTTTESPIVDANGIGDITFVNVDAGDWS